MKIAWFRFLDWAGSKWRHYWKYRRIRKRWPGRNPQDVSRTGRVYSRVSYAAECDDGPLYIIRAEPGWEWTCQQCHTYSIIRESDMPAILEEWADFAERSKKRGFRPAHGVPTAATAGCPECKMRPGAPE